ncbi:MAG: magnesium transporter CorA family protein [Candidatus Wildermuthbacteria bacterium]|nr:magnesium transporter CorA family protein [Candidatus Wildermuthbacteria bacterium]
MRNIITHGTITWIDVQDPAEEDVRHLEENYHVHPVALSELMPPSWRMKVEQFPDHLFLIMYYPAYNKQKKETRGKEIDIIVSKDTLITSHYNFIVPLKALFDQANLYPEKQKECMGGGTAMLLYHILESLSASCLVKLSRISKKLEVVEQEIFSGKEREIMTELLLAKADIIDFLKIVSPQQRIFESLRSVAGEFFGKEAVPYFSRIAGNWEQAKNELETYKETILTLEQTNTSLLSYKTSQILKVLTLFSVIIFPLTLFATLFSMRAQAVPIVGLPGDFWIIIGLMGLITFLMIRYFKRKNWV